MTKHAKWMLVLAFLMIVLGTVLIILGVASNLKVEKQEKIQPAVAGVEPPGEIEIGSKDSFDEAVKVVRVVDGDTIEVLINNQLYKIRYIGIDTPETVDPRRPVACFGKEAAEANKKLVEGKKVLLEKDISDTDKFGRLLRYVYTADDRDKPLFVNDYLVREGFAKISTFPPDVKFAEQFMEAERAARAQNKGLWNKC